MGGSGRGGASTRVGDLLRRIAAFGFAALAGTAFAAEPDGVQILYFEPLSLGAASSSTQQKSTTSRELQFDAFGRRFVVPLQTNEKLSPLLQSKAGIAPVSRGIPSGPRSSSDASPPVQLYKGQINGVAGSWARIAIIDGQLRGMLWDGSELYVMEPVANLSGSLPTNVPVKADTTALFRMADVLMESDATSCGTDSSGVDIHKGSQSYDSLLNELKGAPAIMQAAGATRRLEVSALGDMLFVNRYGTEARARSEILLRLNNVDGIFSSQLGVEIQVPTVDIGDALSETTSPSSLLDELGNLRKRSPNLYSHGLTHLFTGRDLDGETAGLAYMDSLCNQRFGVGLSEARRFSWWTESLIAAHEIGHNFGAPHDGEANKACASTPPDQFLMAPRISNSERFSDCSLDIVRQRVTTSSCITPLPPANIAVQPDLGALRYAVGRDFDWNVTISNLGGVSTTNGRAELVLPPAISIREAFVVGGSCISGAGVISCQLGQVAGGSSTAINLVLRSDVLGTNDVAIRVSAGNDSEASDNKGFATLSIEDEADFGIGLQAPATITNSTPFDVSLTASNTSAIEARNVTVTLDLPAGVTASAARLNGANCSVQDASVTCLLDSLASGATMTGTVSLIASTDGNALLQARIAGGYVDPVVGNDTASATVSVTSPGTSRVSTGSGGGGGSFGGTVLWALLALFGLKQRQRLAMPQARPSRATHPLEST